MQMLYISPHYPAHYGLFIERLSEHGVRVLGITDQPDEAISLELSRLLSGHYRVDNFQNLDQVFAACDFFRRERGGFDRVESHLESWIEVEAAIRERYDIAGPKPDQLKFLKQKSLMKGIFKKAGVPVVRGIVVDTFSESLDFIDGAYPVFIKPDIGVGAADTYTIRSERDLKHFFSVRDTHPYFMEEYLSGVIESFDGLTDRDGNIVFYTSHVFSNDIHKIVAQNENLSYYSVRQLPSDLENYGKKVVKAAELREKFFHVEFFRLPNGSLSGLEINVRPPGGLTTHMFNYACDVDVYDWWASIIAGESSLREYERRYHCAFVGRKHDRDYAHSHDDLYRLLGAGLVHSQPMNPIELQVMGNQGYLVRSPDLNELKSMIGTIVQER